MVLNKVCPEFSNFLSNLSIQRLEPQSALFGVDKVQTILQISMGSEGSDFIKEYDDINCTLERSPIPSKEFNNVNSISICENA